MKRLIKKINIIIIASVFVFSINNISFSKDQKPFEQLIKVGDSYFYFDQTGDLYASKNENMLRRINDTFFFTDTIGRVYGKNIDGYFLVEGNYLDSLIGKKIIYDNLQSIPDFCLYAHDKYYLLGKDKMKQLPDMKAIYVNNPRKQEDNELSVVGDSYAYRLMYYTKKDVEFALRPGYVVSAIKNELLDLIDWNGINYCIVFIGPNDLLNQTDLFEFENNISYICDYIKEKGARPVFISYLGIVDNNVQMTEEFYNHIIECVSIEKNALYINVEDLESIDTAVEETTEEEKIVFDIKIPPNKQRRKIIEHKKEYLNQVYEYMFHDKKFVNCIGYDYLSAYDIVDGFKSLNSLVYLLKGATTQELMKKLFSLENEIKLSNITLNDLPVTEYYKQKHPKPLYEEFEFITKKVDNNIYYTKHDMNILCKFFYNYGIGLNEEEKIVTVYETKSIETYRNFDGEIVNTVVYDKKGNEITEYSADTREFVFKYTLDEKGYVDDIEYVKVNELDGDKYLNEIWQIVKS